MTTEVQATDAADEFDSFFDALAKLKPGEQPPADFGQTVNKDVDAPTEPVNKDIDTPVNPDTTVATPEGGTENEGDGDAAAAAAKAAADKAAVEAAAAKPADEAGLMDRFLKVMEQRQQPQPQPQPPRQQQPAPLYTAEEQAVLNKFNEDWPDLAQALALALRGTTTQNNAYVFGELSKVLGPQLQTMQEVSADHHYDALIRAIPDYDAVAPKVVDWVAKDPSMKPYLRAAYKGVIDNGSVDDISDLVDTWRKATGTSVTPGKAPAAPAAKTGSELSEAAKQAAAALAPVNSKRTVTAPAEPASFEDAFEAHAKAFAATKRKT